VAKDRTAVTITSVGACQPSSPGMSSRITRCRAGSAAITVGARSGATEASSPIAADSSDANGGVSFSHTGPAAVGIRNMPDRFQLRICSGRPVGALPASRSARSAQPSTSRTPSAVAQLSRCSAGRSSPAKSPSRPAPVPAVASARVLVSP
jgi:hypothetical protein